MRKIVFWLFSFCAIVSCSGFAPKPTQEEGKKALPVQKREKGAGEGKEKIGEVSYCKKLKKNKKEHGKESGAGKGRDKGQGSPILKFVGKVGFSVVIAQVEKIYSVPFYVDILKYKKGEELHLKVEKILWKGVGRKRYGILMQNIRFLWLKEERVIKLINRPYLKNKRWMPRVPFGFLKRGKKFIVAFDAWSMGRSSIYAAEPYSKSLVSQIKKRVQEFSKHKK